MALSRILETAVRSSLGIALHVNVRAVVAPRPSASLRLQMVPRARQFHAFAHQAAEIDLHRLGACVLVADFAGLQHLLDRAQQAVGIVQHQLVELLPLRLVHFPRAAEFRDKDGSK